MRPFGLNTRPQNHAADPLAGYVKDGLLLFYDGILNWRQTAGAQDAAFIDQSGHGNHSLPVTEIPSCKTWEADGFSSVETDAATSGRAGVVIPQGLAEVIATRQFTAEVHFRINDNVDAATYNYLLSINTPMNGFLMRANASAALIGAYFGVGVAPNVSVTGNASASRSYVLAGTGDGETFSAAQNGAVIQSKAFRDLDRNPGWAALPLYLGQNAAANNLGLKGTVRTCRIYNRPLTPAELAQNAAEDLHRYAHFTTPHTLMATRAPAFTPDFDPNFDLPPEES